MTNFWNATTYKFLELRTRPAIELLAILPTTFQPQTIYDLGCGPGNSTILLKNRWPTAKIVGLDSSISMLEKARTAYPMISFVESNIGNFSATEKIDLIFANASLQWVEHHQELFPRLADFLDENGALAIQMPNNFHAPSHQVTINILKEHPDWQHLLNHLRYGRLKEPFYQASYYYDLLTRSGLHNLNIWETKYFQEMADHQAIFNWVEGTALRPILSKMDSAEQARFTKLYINQIKKEYTLQENGKVLFPFRRMFMVGFRNT